MLPDLDIILKEIMKIKTVIRDQGRGGRGYSASCQPGFRSPWQGSVLSAAQDLSANRKQKHTGLLLKQTWFCFVFSASAKQRVFYNGPVGPPKWLSGKESPWQRRKRGFDPWAGKIPWRREWQPTPVFLPGESHGQRSLVACREWGCKESDITYWLVCSWCYLPA